MSFIGGLIIFYIFKFTKPTKKVMFYWKTQQLKKNKTVLVKPINYLKGRNFRGKKNSRISRISRFLLKSAKLNSRENFQNRASAKLKVINVNIEIP